MKHEQSAPAGYRPRFAGTMKLYLVRHKEYGELTVNGVNKYEACLLYTSRGRYPAGADCSCFILLPSRR